MSGPRPFDHKRTAKASTVAALDALLGSASIRSAHYVGYAHEPVLRVLHKHFGSAFSVMDYWNRYGPETEFDNDTGERCHEDRRPEWLRGVRFYVEGGSDTDLLIWDMPFHPNQLAEIIDFRVGFRRQPPQHLFLVDEARLEAKHPAYRWTIEADFAIGEIQVH